MQDTHCVQCEIYCALQNEAKHLNMEKTPLLLTQTQGTGSKNKLPSCGLLPVGAAAAEKPAFPAHARPALHAVCAGANPT